MASWRAPAIVVALVAAAMGTAALLWRGGAPDACPGSAFVMRTAAGGSAPYVPSELLSAEAELSWTPVRWVSLGANGRLVRAPRATEPLWSMGLALTLRTDTALAL